MKRNYESTMKEKTKQTDMKMSKGASATSRGSSPNPTHKSE